MQAVPLSTALGIKYSAHFIGTLHRCCTVCRLVFFVLQNAFFGGFQVHSPASLPIMCLARELIKDVTRVSVLQAFDFVPFEFDGIQNFGRAAFILKFLSLEHNKVELVYKA
jgi:hypothetical protein